MNSFTVFTMTSQATNRRINTTLEIYEQDINLLAAVDPQDCSDTCVPAHLINMEIPDVDASANICHAWLETFKTALSDATAPKMCVQPGTWKLCHSGFIDLAKSPAMNKHGYGEEILQMLVEAHKHLLSL